MSKVINEPTREGFEHGYHLARFIDAEEAKGPLPNGRERCHNCAFRQGTYPNGCVTTTMDALKCAMEELKDVCEEIDEYLAGREDADHNGERFVPNKAMKLRMDLRAALARAESYRKQENR